jgi:hypothetical protein
MILKSNLVVLTMVITSLTFVVAAVASSVAVNIFSLSRRLLKSVQPPQNGLIPPYRFPSGNTLTANSISSNTTR